MAGWAGFSEDELRRLQNKDSVVPAVSGRVRKPVPTNRSRQQLQRERALQVAAQQDASGPLPSEQQLDKPKVLTPSQTEPKTSKTEGTPQAENEDTTNESHTPCPVTVANSDMTPKELEKQEVELREKTRLELLQQEQRMIEEKNKRKKALLSKTIAEKSKRTQAEAVKLKRIQKELQALDDMVSNDIGILRGRIEQASWEYSAARKRYEKAEAEFVTAKLDLHKKTEAKERLTEHLYTIIQQNEQRKASKLEELMQQLEMQADEEQLELEIQVERLLQEEEQATGAAARAECASEAGETPRHSDAAPPQHSEQENDLPTLPERRTSDLNCESQDPPPSHECAGREVATPV
ncbi:RAB6-interacting golgin [Paramormyrops kingsleyae]|uniref:RAB6-interacting golgin n=1 Tax=Paramormyrops kingsleyae TaxID=1676925 RepID=A0A3B3T9G9_9TELE|nr:RAB6-interacting golgin [Paramormyrops kingsleyae]